MSILSSKKAGVLIVMPDIRLDTQTAPATDQLIVEAIAQGETRILVDFAKTNYISSAGLRVLLIVTKPLKKAGGQLLIVCARTGYVYEVLETSGFTNIIPVFESVEEAARNAS